MLRERDGDGDSGLPRMLGHRHDERRRELREVHGRMREAAEALEVRAVEVLELTKLIEELTGGTPEWYAGMRVEAAETVRQARVLARTLGPLDESTDVSGGLDGVSDGISTPG